MSNVTLVLTEDEIISCIKGLQAEISEFDIGEASRGWVTESLELIDKLNSYLPKDLQRTDYRDYMRDAWGG
jgi:hypothetical protein